VLEKLTYQCNPSSLSGLVGTTPTLGPEAFAVSTAVLRLRAAATGISSARPHTSEAILSLLLRLGVRKVIWKLQCGSDLLRGDM
jgi:hypothetical protein